MYALYVSYILISYVLSCAILGCNSFILLELIIGLGELFSTKPIIKPRMTHLYHWEYNAMKFETKYYTFLQQNAFEMLSTKQQPFFQTSTY